MIERLETEVRARALRVDLDLVRVADGSGPTRTPRYQLLVASVGVRVFPPRPGGEGLTLAELDAWLHAPWRGESGE